MGLLRAGGGGGAAALLVAVAALHQVSGGGQCFRLDGLRLLANLAEALRRSGGGGAGGGGGAWGLRLWLHVAPPQAPLPGPQLLLSDLPEARIGRTRITLDPYRNVLEVEGFPADLDVGFRDNSSMNTVVDSGEALSVKEVSVEGNTILRDLQLVEDGSHPPGHVVLSVDPWSAHATGLGLLPQLVVVVRTRSGLSCELALPDTVEGARRLLGHVSQLEARHEITEVVLLISEFLQDPLMNCENLVWAESPPAAPVFISPGGVLAAWRVSGGGLWLGPRLQSLALPPPPATPTPPPVQLRACLPHSGLEADAVPAYWRKVFAIITEAMSTRVTVSEPPPNESAVNPRQQDPSARAPPAVAPPSLFHRRARQSYLTNEGNTFVNNSTINNIWQGRSHDGSSQSDSRDKHRESGVRTQGNPRGQARSNYKLPRPCHVTIANRHVEVPYMPLRWPFQQHAKHIPRYAWRRNTWEEFFNKNGEWKTVTPRRSLNQASHMYQPLYVFINDIWCDKTSDSFYTPKKLLQYKRNSSPTYVWINGKWVPIIYNKNLWILTSSGEGKKKCTSQNKEQIVCDWDTKNRVLCKFSNQFTMNNRPDQQGSSDTWRSGGYNPGNNHPSNGSQSKGSQWYLEKEGDQTGKRPLPPPYGSHNQQETPPRRPHSGKTHPSYGSHNEWTEGNQSGKLPLSPSHGSNNEKWTSSGHPKSGDNRPSDGLINDWGNSPTVKVGKVLKKRHIPLPFGSYIEEGVPPSSPNSANSCPCHGSHNDGLESPPGKVEKQRGNVKFPLPYGSYNEKWTSSRLPNTGNQGSHNDERKSPPGKGKNQPGKQHLPLPFGSYTVEGISPAPPYNEKWTSLRLPNTGNQGSHNDERKSPPGKGKNQPGKQHLPLPFGSYTVEGNSPAPPNSAINCPCRSSHYDGSKSPPGTGEKQTGNVKLPLPYGSYNEKWTPSTVPNTGNQGSHNDGRKSPPGKGTNQQGKQHLPLPFGSYKVEGIPPAPPNSANNCPCRGSHYDLSKSPTGKGEKQTGNIKIPLPYGSYNEKWTSSRLTNTGNQGSQNDGRKSPPGKGSNQAGNQHLPLPFGSYILEGIPPEPPNSANNCPCRDSHYDGSPPVKVEKQTGNVKFPLPYGSYNEKRTSTGLPNTGNNGPCQGSNNDGRNSPPEKGNNQPGKQHLPLPFGSYKVEGIPTAPPKSANYCPFSGSHFDRSKLPSGKGEKQIGNVKFPLPYGSYNEKWTSSGLLDTGNNCPCQ